MPKVINQTGVSVDSLQAKLTLLENQFSRLNSKYEIISDSLKTVNQTALKSEICTSFYNTHLSNYLVITFFLIGLVTALNWAALLIPLKNKVRADLAKVKTDFEQLKTNDLKSALIKINLATSTAYRTISITYKESFPEVSLVYSLRILKLLDEERELQPEEKEWRDEQFIIWRDNALKYVTKASFETALGNDVIEESISILSFFIENKNYTDHKIIFHQILSEFASKTVTKR